MNLWKQYAFNISYELGFKFYSIVQEYSSTLNWYKDFEQSNFYYMLQGKETSGMVLGIQKELESRGYKGLLVATALNHDMAVQAIWTILNTNKGINSDNHKILEP